MRNTAVGRGKYLAELIRYYHHYRTDFLRWSGKESFGLAEAISSYQRGLLAWYEARIHPDAAYDGDPYVFVKSAAAHYAGKPTAEISGRAELIDLGKDPLRYLPPALRLDDRKQAMLRQFQTMSSDCRELLLLAYYHQLSDERIAAVLELEEPSAEEYRKRCMRIVRDGWIGNGFDPDGITAHPAQHELIDRYQRGELEISERWEVEAQRSSELLFREAFELREDWDDCVRVAGRQDTLATLEREEEDYRVKEAPKPAPSIGQKGPIPEFPKTMQPYLVLALVAVLGWLLISTFALSKEQRLYRSFFSPLPPPSYTDDQMGRDLESMLEPYESGDYLTAYDELLPAATAYPPVPLYLGISALALEEPARALQWFNQYRRGDLYSPYAEWYSVMAYLAMDLRPAALGLAIEISGQPGHPFERRATELVESLE